MLKIIIPAIAGTAVFVLMNKSMNKKCDCKTGEDIMLGQSVNSFPCFKQYSWIPLISGAITAGAGYLVMSNFKAK